MVRENVRRLEQRLKRLLPGYSVGELVGSGIHIQKKGLNWKRDRKHWATIKAETESAAIALRHKLGHRYTVLVDGVTIYVRSA